MTSTKKITSLIYSKVKHNFIDHFSTQKRGYEHKKKVNDFKVTLSLLKDNISSNYYIETVKCTVNEICQGINFTRLFICYAKIMELEF